MVLEHFYSVKLLEKHHFYAFVIGLTYSIIGIGLAVILFPNDPAMVAVAFISIMLLPTLRKLLHHPLKKRGLDNYIKIQKKKGLTKKEIDEKLINVDWSRSLIENTIENMKGFSMGSFWRNYKDILFIYTLIFLGILLAFSLFSLMMPSLATNHIFQNQIDVMYGGTVGKAAFSKSLFINLFQNNILVLIICLIAAFIFGDGGIFIITWNASVWGTIFGKLANTAAINASTSPFMLFSIIIFVVFPHMILEAFSYFSAATCGTIFSKSIINKYINKKNFLRIMKNICSLLLFAIIILFIAVTVETLVLKNVTIYQKIIQLSFARI